MLQYSIYQTQQSSPAKQLTGMGMIYDVQKFIKGFSETNFPTGFDRILYSECFVIGLFV
jgi:hypothetical protein